MTPRETALTTAHPPSEKSAQQKAQNRKDKALIAAIVALFASGAAGYGLLVGMRAALRAWGLPIEIAEWLSNLAAEDTTTPDLGIGEPGPLQKLEAQQAPLWRALYVWGAAERLLSSPDLVRAERAEVGYFARQLAAEARRARAAALVDLTSRLLGDRVEEQPDEHVPLLGWRAVIDDRTTPACRWANGRNFRADRIPIIGFPGAVHPRCRCTSGPPIKGAPLILSA